LQFILLLAALFFDIFDATGRAGRGVNPYWEPNLDSFPTSFSFGVAPAVLGFTLGMRGGWDMLRFSRSSCVRYQPSGTVQCHGQTVLSEAREK